MKHNSPTSQPLDYSAYQQPLSWRAIAKQLYASTTIATVSAAIRMAIVLAAIVAVGIQSIQQGSFGSLFSVFLIIMFAGAVAVKSGALHSVIEVKQKLRMQQFAQANAFAYTPSRTASAYAGMLFADADFRSSFNTIISGVHAGLPFEFGNASFVTGSGKSTRINHYGVVCVTLSRRVPHVLLDSKHNNSWGMSNFASLKRSQRLQLEGNFNQYFDLFVPAGYERDALYFLTPELMALLIDNGAGFDIETVDDRLFIYSSNPFNLQTQAAVERVFALIDSIGTEFQQNTQRYADANVGSRAANIVAEPGQRLKKSWPWLVVIAVIASMILAFVN